MNPRMSRQRLMAMVILGLAGWAAASPASAESVTFKVLGIRATNEEKPHIDPELEPLKNDLARSGFNSFHVAAKQRVTTEIGKSIEVALLEDFAVRLEPQGQTDTDVKLLATMIHYEKDKDGKRIARVLERAPKTVRKGKYLL